MSTNLDNLNDILAVDGKQPADANIVSDANYVHTDNNYTTTDATKVSYISVTQPINLDTIMDNPVFTGSITEEVSVCTLALEPDNGTIQTYTAVADPTFTDGLAEGQFMTLIYTNGGFTATFPTITWWGGNPPTLGTTDKLYFEKIGGVLYGTHVGSIA